MKTKFTLDTTAVKAEIFLNHGDGIPAHYAAGTLASALSGIDFPGHAALISLLADLNKATGWMIDVSGVDTTGEFTARLDAGGKVVEHTCKSGTATGRVKAEDSKAVHGMVGRTVIAGDDSKPELRETLRLDFLDLELRILANYLVEPMLLSHLTHFIGKRLCEELAGRPVNNQLIFIAEGITNSVLRDFCAANNLSMDWVSIELPGASNERVRLAKEREELEAKERALEKEAKRKARVAAGIARALRTVRRSHIETLTTVFGDTDAAEAVMREIEAHLNVYYGCADKVTFNNSREHAESLINNYIADKVASMQHTTVINNVNVNIDKDADVEMIQKVCGNISTTEMKTNSAREECQAAPRVLNITALDKSEGESFSIGDDVLVVVGKPISMTLGENVMGSHTHAEPAKDKTAADSPFLVGKTAPEKIQWLLNNVDDAYLSSNLEMYCDMEDVKDYLLSVWCPRPDLRDEFKRVYGFDPINENFIAQSTHLDVVNKVKTELELEQANHKKCAVKLKSATNEVDNLNKMLTDRTNTLNRFKSAFCDVDSALNPLR